MAVFGRLAVAEEEGVEPTEDARRLPTDLKSARPTGDVALPRSGVARRRRACQSGSIPGLCRFVSDLALSSQTSSAGSRRRCDGLAAHPPMEERRRPRGGARHVEEDWRVQDFDVMVIGQGHAGLTAAKLAAERGLRTANVEGRFPGGLVTIGIPVRAIRGLEAVRVEPGVRRDGRPRPAEVAATDEVWRRQLRQFRVSPSAVKPSMAPARTQSHPASQAIAVARITRPRSSASSGTNARSAMGTAPIK